MRTQNRNFTIINELYCSFTFDLIVKGLVLACLTTFLLHITFINSWKQPVIIQCNNVFLMVAFCHILDSDNGTKFAKRRRTFPFRAL